MGEVLGGWFGGLGRGFGWVNGWVEESWEGGGFFGTEDSDFWMSE